MKTNCSFLTVLPSRLSNFIMTFCVLLPVLVVPSKDVLGQNFGKSLCICEFDWLLQTFSHIIPHTAVICIIANEISWFDLTLNHAFKSSLRCWILNQHQCEKLKFEMYFEIIKLQNLCSVLYYTNQCCIYSSQTLHKHLFHDSNAKK